MEKTKIILDCDPGHDDAVAITLAANSDKIDLLRRVSAVGVMQCVSALDVELAQAQEVAYGSVEILGAAERRVAAEYVAGGGEGHGDDAPPPVYPAQSLRLGHQPGKGQGQSGGGHHQQQVIDVIGGVEIVHALLVQQVPQRDLVQGADGLGNKHGDRQQGGAP